MSPSIQFDPALKQLLLETTGNLLDESIPEEIGAREVPVAARLVDPMKKVDGLKVISRSGNIVTGRLRLDQIVKVHQHPNISSLKASAIFGSSLIVSIPEIHATAENLREAFPPEGVTGRGTVIGFADWGCDFAHTNLRNSQGGTRLLCIWDQRGGQQPESPEPYGYGRVLSREKIDWSLGQPDPYTALGYDPADSDTDGTGTHSTHVIDIAAGNGTAARSAPGVAPEAELIFVHLKGDDTRPEDNLGDSVRVMEAISFIVDYAGDRPLVINLSLGKTGGPHDQTPLATQYVDALLERKAGRSVVMSAGNYFMANLHSSGQFCTGESVDLHWSIALRNEEIVEMEVWYPGVDQFAVELIDPSGKSLGVVYLGEDHVVRNEDRIICSIFHRQGDPNNGDNHIDIFLWPDAAIGSWTTRLRGQEVKDGRYHAWIERAKPTVQARFEPESATFTHTTNTICNGRRTIAVGAYDARSPENRLGPFSSSGPSRDGRLVPVISAPGVGIRAARSSYPASGGRSMNGLTIKTGTSMAAPHVSGVIALMFEAAGIQRLTAEQTRQILISTARIDPQDPEYQRYGAGRIDAAAAVQRVLALKSKNALLTNLPVTEITREEMNNMEIQVETDLPLETDEIAILKGGESCDEFFSDLEELAEVSVEINPLQRKLAPILPNLLVEVGDAQLHRRDKAGHLLYDKLQPLLFGPSGRNYASGPGRFNYHAADFVYNTAYEVGYDVPVYPLSSTFANSGRAYINLAATFKALAENNGGDLGSYLYRFFEVVSRPGETVYQKLRPGDLLLRGSQPGADYGHIAIIVDPKLREMNDPFFLVNEHSEGKGIHCISAGLTIQDKQARCGYALIDQNGNVLSNRMVIRFKDSSIDSIRAATRLENDASYRSKIEHAYWTALPQEDLEKLFGEESIESTPDSAAAVPAFNNAKRSQILMPLLSAAQNASAITWNSSNHPRVSGVNPDEIRSALASYIDFSAVASAIASYNASNPSVSIASGSVPFNAIFVEAIHQFQAKSFAESSQVDGKAGESTLDSLGFIQRTGMNAMDRPNARAQGRLNRAATRIRTATAGEFTAANWFQNMANPTFLCQRLNNGIHLVLARKLRIAENSLLSKREYSGLTPVELGRALGINEEHKGARPNASSNSMHTFGLAVDIQYSSNPWIAGQHIERDEHGTITPEGQETQRANEQFTRAVNRAALLVSGVIVNFTPGYLHSLRNNSSLDIYNLLAQRNADLKAYLRMHNDLTAIQTKLAERQAAGTAGVFNSGETPSVAASRWRMMIAEDLTNLRSSRSNFSGRNPLNGFLNLNRDLVIALRDAAGLAWGAVDLGGRESGDIMHFDDRLSGVGQIASNSR